MDTVLRVYGEQFDVDVFLNQYPDLLVSDAFKKGEPDMLGNPSEFSGFDMIVAENETGPICIEKIQRLLTKYQSAFDFLKTNAMHVVLDLDVTVKADDDMPQSFNLPALLMGELHEGNIAIEFSAYPHFEVL